MLMSFFVAFKTRINTTAPTNADASNARTRFRRTLALACALAAVGCASQPLGYQIRSTGDKVINRDETGNPLSVVVRMYQLKDRKAFSKLTLDELSSGRSDEELFGDELVNRTEVVVVPGQRASSPAQLAAETRFVGVVAMFRQPDLDHWRYLVPAERLRSNSAGLSVALGNLFTDPAESTSGLVFTVRDCSIAILAPEPELLAGQRPQRSSSCPGVQTDEASSVSQAASPVAGNPGGPRQRNAAKPPRRTKHSPSIAGNE